MVESAGRTGEFLRAESESRGAYHQALCVPNPIGSKSIFGVIAHHIICRPGRHTKHDGKFSRTGACTGPVFITVNQQNHVFIIAVIDMCLKINFGATKKQREAFLKIKEPYVKAAWERRIKMINQYKEQAANGKRWCYDCKQYYTDSFGGYKASSCWIYGSLDIDQKERHPDTTADTCKDYEPNGEPPWYEKYL